MLDKRCVLLLEYIDKECAEGGYKVFEVKELLAALPAEFGADAEELERCVLTLSAKEYINVKYIDEEEICLTPLSRGRLLFEKRLDDEIEQARAEKRYFAFSFTGAFFGAGFAAAVAFLIAFLAGACRC